MLARLGLLRTARLASAAPLFRTVQPPLAARSAHSSLLPLSRQFHLSRSLLRPSATSSFRDGDPTHCPSCSAPLLTPFAPLCPSCSSLVPPPSSITSCWGPFDFFGLPIGHALDRTQAALEYSKLQEQLHPDLFSGQGEREEWAKSWRKKVNDSYHYLLDDRTRAAYLLDMYGFTIYPDENEPFTRPWLFREIDRMRRAIECATCKDEVSDLRSSICKDLKRTNASLATTFAIVVSSNWDDDPQVDALLTAYTLVLRLQYLHNAKTACDNWVYGQEIDLHPF